MSLCIVRQVWMAFSPQWERKTLVPLLLTPSRGWGRREGETRGEQRAVPTSKILLFWMFAGRISIKWTLMFWVYTKSHIRYKCIIADTICFSYVCMLSIQWPQTGNWFGVGSHSGSFLKNKFVFEMDSVAFTAPSSKWHLFNLSLALA